MKAHYHRHHHQQSNQQQSHHHHHPHHQHNHHSSHNGTSNSAGTYKLGPNSQNSISTPPAAKISSTAFPLLLSSIESGRQNYANSVSSNSTKSSSNGSSQNATALNTSSSNVCYRDSSYQFGLNKSKARTDTCSSSNTNHCNGNSGVKLTPKCKTVATPNLVASNGRHQANYGHCTNGHTQTKSSHLTVDCTHPSSHTSSLPFKKNTLSRELGLHNNNAHSRNRVTPYKDGKSFTLTNNQTVTNTLGAKKADSIRPPNVRSNSSSKHTNGAHAKASSQYNHYDNVNGGGGVGVMPFTISKKDLDVSCESNSPKGQCATVKPKEFKFFKEKAKDKQHRNEKCDTDTSTSSSTKANCKQSSKSPKANNTNKKASSVTTKKSLVKESKKRPDKSSTKSGGQIVPRGKCNKASSGQDDDDDGISDHVQLSLTDNESVHLISQSLVENHRQVRVISFTEYIIENFALHAFTTLEDLIVSE